MDRTSLGRAPEGGNGVLWDIMRWNGCARSVRKTALFRIFWFMFMACHGSMKLLCFGQDVWSVECFGLLAVKCAEWTDNYLDKRLKKIIKTHRPRHLQASYAFFCVGPRLPGSSRRSLNYRWTCVWRNQYLDAATKDFGRLSSILRNASQTGPPLCVLSPLSIISILC